MNLYSGWDKWVLVLFNIGSNSARNKSNIPPRNWICAEIQRLWKVRMNCKCMFTLEWTLTLQVLNRLTEGEREREKIFFCPKKCPKRNFRKWSFCLVGKSERSRFRRGIRERTSNKLCFLCLYVFWIYWRVHGFVNLNLGWDKGVLVLLYRKSEKKEGTLP